MTPTPVDPTIVDYYSDSYDEDARLRLRPAGRIEFLRTQELLRRHLSTAPAEVLDIGGGTGIHAEWLATDGHMVRLLDPVPAHVAKAAAIEGVEAEVGYAGELPYGDDSADATLLLGPLYHLPDTSEPLAVEAMTTGVNDPEHGFTVAYFHAPDELRAEFVAAGLIDVVVYGVEGPSIPVLLTLPPAVAEDRVDSDLRAARIVERDPAMLAASPHLLAVGRVSR